MAAHISDGASAPSGDGHLAATRIAYRLVSILTMAFVVVASILAVAHLMGMRFYVVASGSMTPTMPTGSLCVVWEGYPYDEVAPGDIVAFRTDAGDITTHRVTAVTSRGLVTKGDANDDIDALPVTRMGYAGRSIWHAVGLGGVTSLLLSPVGIGIIVAGVLALLVAELALKRAAVVEEAADEELERLEAEVAGPSSGLDEEAIARIAAREVRAALAEYFGPVELGGSMPGDAQADERPGAEPDESGEGYE